MDILASYFENEKKDKVKRYKILNQYVKKGQVLFTGSSLMEQFPIYEFIQDYDIKKTIYNRGIGGYTSVEMLQELDVMIFDLEPSKIFINIGTNDLSAVDYSKEGLVKQYEAILDQIRKRLPDTQLYIMAYYPVNGEFDFGNEYAKQWLKVRTNARILEANQTIEMMAQKYSVKYVDVNQNLFDDKGNLKSEYSVEGVHMYGNGYRAIFDNLMEYVNE